MTITKNPDKQKNKSYYTETFEKLIGAGVPHWYIRLYLLNDLIYTSRAYVFFNPYDEESHNGWYASNGICISDTPADRNRKCYGEIKSKGFPEWEEYKILFLGGEFKNDAENRFVYEQHKDEWNAERLNEGYVRYVSD